MDKCQIDEKLDKPFNDAMEHLDKVEGFTKFLKHILFVSRPIKWRCYMKKKFMSVFTIALLLTGCNEKENNLLVDVLSDVNLENNMPEEMPNDFDFLVQFGFQSKNEINTFENIVIKDLIAEGTVSTEISFTQEEKKKIYQKMREINIMEPKELIPEETNCVQTPYGEDKWKVKLNGETQTLYRTGKYCETTDHAKQLIEIRNFILDIVKSKDEYKKLPEAKGAYE